MNQREDDIRKLCHDIETLLVKHPAAFFDITRAAAQGIAHTVSQLREERAEKDRAFIACLALLDKTSNRGATRTYLRGIIEDSISKQNASETEHRFLNEDF